ncbi:MAG: tyrosine-type recombinase/integrase [Chloroflexi bacterium]|nr:tyrosine-type recombinase/integrase [Chloroflexota bacterium]
MTQEIIIYSPPGQPVPTCLPTDGRSAAIDLAIAAWLHAKRNASGSAKTETAYTNTMQEFRLRLQGTGMDLDGDPASVALAAQAFASDGDPAPATVNQRTAILSSFYRYCLRMGLLELAANPIERVQRRKVDAYRGAVALDVGEIKNRLSAIDRVALAGARDYALLLIGLTTGRRLSELAGLRLRHITPKGGGKLEILWERCKGGKQMRDVLAAHVGQALLSYLKLAYPTGKAGPDAPVWIPANGSSHDRPLSKQAIADICLKRLGTPKVHTLRHTFAHSMEQSGAKISGIQAKLGHESLATTGIYLSKLKQAENEHADTLAALFCN